MNIGISTEQRKAIADGLSHLLADTYTLYLKTHSFHWNVEGPMFTALHTLFETQYNELALAVDTIAERIRALGYPAPGSYQQFLKLTNIKETTQTIPAMEMVSHLMNDHETVARTAREIFSIVDEAVDESSADLITQRLQIHEKNAWMLRSLLK